MHTEHHKYVEEIVEALTALQSRSVPDLKKSTWTRTIKEVIGGIGVKHGFNVCTSGFKGRFEGEWLYDLIWYRNNENNRLNEVPLVLESEWDLDAYGIRYDFEKLLVANSPLKVMVFQNAGDSVDEAFERLRCGIDEYVCAITCTYVLACYWQDGSRVEIKTFSKEPIKPPEPMPILIPRRAESNPAQEVGRTG